MEVEAIFNPVIVAVQDWETIRDASARMRFNDVGSAAVFSEGRLAGIITERDLTRALADGVDPDRTTVDDYMTPDPATVSPHTDARDAARSMIDLGVRHLPVMEDEKLVGMVSVRDVLDDGVWTPA